MLPEKFVHFVALLTFIAVVGVVSHPTTYKLNENAKLEPDLIPVSSTVIPLPVYQIGYGIKGIESGKFDHKYAKPDEPLTLITVHSKKKAYSMPKLKQDHVSIVKEVKN